MIKRLYLLMIALLLALPQFGAYASDVIGYAVKSDIRAFVDGQPIESFNIDGYTYIKAESLRYLHYRILVDNHARTLKIGSAAYELMDYTGTKYQFNGYTHENDADNIGKVYPLHKNSYSAYITDITGKTPDIPIHSYNMDGFTLVRLDDLAPLGSITWDGDKREIHFAETPPILDNYTLWLPYLKTGSIIGSAKLSDMEVYVNGALIPAYEYDGRVCVSVERLLRYGIRAENHGEGTITILPSFTNEGKNYTFAPEPFEVPPKGTVYDVYENTYTVQIMTENSVYKEVPSHNINGEIVIPLEELALYGDYVCDTEAGEVRFDEYAAWSFGIPDNDAVTESDSRLYFGAVRDDDGEFSVQSENCSLASGFGIGCGYDGITLSFSFFSDKLSNSPEYISYLNNAVTDSYNGKIEHPDSSGILLCINGTEYRPTANRLTGGNGHRDFHIRFDTPFIPLEEINDITLVVGKDGQ